MKTNPSLEQLLKLKNYEKMPEHTKEQLLTKLQVLYRQPIPQPSPFLTRLSNWFQVWKERISTPEWSLANTALATLSLTALLWVLYTQPNPTQLTQTTPQFQNNPTQLTSKPQNPAPNHNLQHNTIPSKQNTNPILPTKGQP
jgi:hypothetical protein